MSTPQTFVENKRIQTIVLAVGIVLLAVKFVAWGLTNSNAILTDALESIINVVAGGFALFSLYLAAQPKDLNHPYGHGKVEYLSSGFEGGLIFIAGVTMIGKSIYNFFYPQNLHSLDAGLLLVAAPGLVNFLMGMILVKMGKKNNSLVMVADGKHLLSDAYSSVGLVVGLLLALIFQITWMDNVTAIVFGLLILYTGYQLVRESIAGIMDEADTSLLNNLIEKMDTHRQPNWIDAHNLRIIKFGAWRHVDCHLTVPYYFSVKEAHDEVAKFEQQLAELSEAPIEFFIHTDPCRPPLSCKLCRKTDCLVREAPFENHISWILSNVLENKQHHRRD